MWILHAWKNGKLSYNYCWYHTIGSLFFHFLLFNNLSGIIFDENLWESHPYIAVQNLWSHKWIFSTFSTWQPFCPGIDYSIFSSFIFHFSRLLFQTMHGGLFSKDDVTIEDIRKVDRNRQPPDSGINFFTWRNTKTSLHPPYHL